MILLESGSPKFDFVIVVSFCSLHRSLAASATKDQSVWSKYNDTQFFASYNYAIPHLIYQKSIGASVDLDKFKRDSGDLDYCASKCKELGIGASLKLHGIGYNQQVLRSRGDDVDISSGVPSSSETLFKETLTSQEETLIQEKINEFWTQVSTVISSEPSKMYQLRSGPFKKACDIYDAFRCGLSPDLAKNYFDVCIKVTDFLLECVKQYCGSDARSVLKQELMKKRGLTSSVYSAANRAEFNKFRNQLKLVTVWLQDVKIYARRNALRPNGVADAAYAKRSHLSMKMILLGTAKDINILLGFENLFWKFDDYTRIPVAGMYFIFVFAWGNRV